MNVLRVQRSFDVFLKDPNLSLRAKGYLALILLGHLSKGYDAKDFCTDSKDDIQDTLLELRINHYIRYNPEDNTLEADAVPYDKCDEEYYEL